MEFKAVILSEIGDYLIQKPGEMEWIENGLELTNPYVVNEEGLAQELQADKILVTKNALQGVQKGEFEEELLK